MLLNEFKFKNIYIKYVDENILILNYYLFILIQSNVLKLVKNLRRKPSV